MLNINKKPSLFDSSPSCFMAKGSKVKKNDDSDSELDPSSESENDDEPTKKELMDILEQADSFIKSRNKKCKAMQKEINDLMHSLSELSASHETLKEEHEDHTKAYTRLVKAHSLLQEDMESRVVSSCDVGITCDIIDESFFQPIVMQTTNPSCSTSSTTTNPSSTPSDNVTCDTSLKVENETLKREVGELTHALGKAYGGEARLLKCLGNQRWFSFKEGLGYTPKKGKAAFVPSKPRFVKGNGPTYQKKKQVGQQENNHNNNAKMNNTSMVKFAKMSFIRLDSFYVLTKGEKDVKAKYVGTPKLGPKMKATWVPKCLVANLQGPKQAWVPKTY
jgi:hypothetical protein